MFYIKSLRYKDILNIKELTIETGKITVIVGQTGGGKTTLLKLLNKTISPDQGEIYYHGTSLNTINSIALRREVVYLSQTPYLFDGSVYDNLVVGCRFHNKDIPSEKQLKDTLKMVALDHDLKQNVKHFSGGEKQRLALGRILLLNPSCFLLDEPSSALDDQTENILINTIVNHVKRVQKTLVMISHSKAIAKQYGDIVYEMNEGTLKRRVMRDE